MDMNDKLAGQILVKYLEICLGWIIVLMIAFLFCISLSYEHLIHCCVGSLKFNSRWFGHVSVVLIVGYSKEILFVVLFLVARHMNERQT